MGNSLALYRFTSQDITNLPLFDLNDFTGDTNMD